MDTKRVEKYYHALCKNEGMEPLPIKFCRVAKGGACLVYNPKTMQPISIQIDLKRVHDVEYAIIHELTHQIKILSEKDPYLGKRDQLTNFKKVENRLVEKYVYSNFSELLWK